MLLKSFQTENEILNRKINFLLHLADNSLILSHRNSEWCGHGPVLEQDIAITNISLDLIGQARNFYQYAAELLTAHSGNQISEDDLAYLRDAWDYKNLLICELPKGDWAVTTARQFFVSCFQYYAFKAMMNSSDNQIAAIAEKAFKEVSYHLKWSSEWVIRLGDGTAESRSRMETAIADLWPFTGELFDAADYEEAMDDSDIAPLAASFQQEWNNKVAAVFEEAGIAMPTSAQHQRGGKQGVHTEYLGYILAEMQFLQRAYPGLEW